jgi:hypothetical protein
MKPRKLAVIGSITALMLAAAPVTAIAATNAANHHPATSARVEHSSDLSGERHADPTSDKTSPDKTSSDKTSPDASVDSMDR